MMNNHAPETNAQEGARVNSRAVSDPRTETLKRMALLAISIAGMMAFGPAVTASTWPHIDPLGGLFLAATIATGLAMLETGSAHMLSALRHVKPHTTTKHKATSRLITKRRQFKGKVSSRKAGLYLGAMNGKPLMINTQRAAAMVIGPNGSGKDTRFQFLQMALCGESFISLDLASEGITVEREFLERKGYRVVVLDFAQAHDAVGQTDFNNPFDVFANALTRTNGIQFINDDGAQTWASIIQEPPGGAKDPMWIKAARKHACTISIAQAFRKLHDATFADIKELIGDRITLRDILAFQVGSLEIVDPETGEKKKAGFDYESAPFRSLHDAEYWVGFVADHKANCQAIVDLLDSAAADSKLWEGIAQEIDAALTPFGRNTRIHEVMSKTTAPFSNLKTEKCAFFITADQARSKSQYKAVGLLVSHAMREIIAHQQHRRMTYLFLGEINLIKIEGLLSFIQGARKFMARVILLPQNFAGFDVLYGEKTRSAILNELEALVALPGIQEDKTLDLLEKMTGKATWFEKSQNVSLENGADVISETVTERTRPVVSRQKIKELDGQALLLRQGEHAAIVDVPYYSETTLRDYFSANPLYSDKPWRLPLKLRLSRSLIGKLAPRRRKQKKG